MKHLTLTKIASVCQGTIIGEVIEKDIIPESVVIDSRLVSKNSIFIATKGERVDGHQFISQAFAKGALAVICEELPEELLGPCILVKDSLQALRDIAKWHRIHLNIKVVGITGSAGKTSTKECISSVLEQKYSVLKTQGNLNNEIGLPLTILRIKDIHEVAVVEMGISDFGEMEVLSDIAKPDICVITNIGDSHLEMLGDRHGVLKAKQQIFQSMNPEGIAVLNGDDELLQMIKDVHGKKPITYGFHSSNDIYAANVRSNGLFGSTFEIHASTLPENFWKVDLPLPGKHMVSNALAATAIGLSLDLSMEQIIAGLASIQAINGRSNIIQHKQMTIVDDCYNANPSSMKAAIDLLAQANTRKIAILGDMKELGVNELALHHDVGQYAAHANIDVILCAGPLAKNIYEGASEKTDKNVSYFDTKEKLLEALPELIQPSDTVLIKASHSMGFETIVSELLK